MINIYNTMEILCTKSIADDTLIPWAKMQQSKFGMERTIFVCPRWDAAAIRNVVIKKTECAWEVAIWGGRREREKYEEHYASR